MLKTSANYFPELTRVRQITESYCGPAVLQMLLSFHSFWTTQGFIIDAAGVSPRIDLHGTTVWDLAHALTKIAPHLAFWYKDYSVIDDLSTIVETYHHPVGVEWQGVFGENEEQDVDGHYSVVTHVNITEGFILLADPFSEFAGRDRKFSIIDFNRRWWDYNEIPNKYSGIAESVRDERMMFTVTTSEANFPEIIGMKKWNSVTL